MLKHLGRDATELELADMLSELYKAAGGFVDALSFAAIYAVLAPKLLVEAERNWRRTAAADADAEAFQEPRRRPDGDGDGGRDRGRATRRAALRAHGHRARVGRGHLQRARPGDGKVSFDAFQRVMAAAAVEGSALGDGCCTTKINAMAALSSTLN